MSQITHKETTEKEELKALNGDLHRFLAFSLGEEEYAVPLLKVKEVIAMPDITPVPYTPQHFLGIMNLRGQVISVIDMRLKFRMPKAERGPETAVIILDLAPLCLGIVVNSVNSVLAVEDGDVDRRPDIESKGGNTDYILGVTRKDKKLVILLDIAKSLSVEEIMAAQRGAGSQAA